MLVRAEIGTYLSELNRNINIVQSFPVECVVLSFFRVIVYSIVRFDQIENIVLTLVSQQFW